MTETAFQILSLLVFVPAIVLHEVAHGYVSYRLGDPTAKMHGRLSLNPLVHVDPFGTVLLPLGLALMGMPVFGYAKGVPINPHYYKNYRTGLLLSGLAGPATNLALAIVAGLLVRFIRAVAMVSLSTATGAPTFAGWIVLALYFFADINLVLMFFNLIPMPPLDGSRVLPVFLSDRAIGAYHRFERYGIMIFFAVLIILPDLLGVDIIGGYFGATVDPIMRLLTGVAL